MANFFTRLFDTSFEDKYQEATALVETLSLQNMGKEFEVERLKESMTDLMRYFEDLNWVKLDGWEEDRGFTLDAIKDNSDRLRALLSINPTIKKAMNARVGYIWSRGVSFEGPKAIEKITKDPHNNNIIFGDHAHWPLESQLATDGNLWTVRNHGTNTLTHVPIEQIAGWVLDPNDPTRVIYWARFYTINTKNFSTGVPDMREVKEFIPAHGYTGNRVSSIDGIKVNKNATMVHLAVNRQTNWILGVPDLIAAMFWAKAHKELFESGTTYVKAQGKFASKVVSKTTAGAQRSAATIAEAPRRDPNSGEILDTGGTAVMSGGLDYQLMGKMSGGVDFEAFDPVAGLIAVGLGIPREVILGKSDTEEKTLEQSVVDEMRMRQKMWTWYFKALFGDRDVTVVWPKIKSEPTYRMVQSLEISNKTVSLSREEIRAMTLEAYGIEGDPNELPDIEENAAFLMQKAVQDNAAENAEKAAEQAADTAVKVAQATTPEQGVDAGVGKLSTGKDRNAARDDKSDRNVKAK